MLIIVLCQPKFLFGQVSGTVTDSLNNPLNFASIVFYTASFDRTLAFTYSDTIGRFTVDFPQKEESCFGVANYLGYKSDTVVITKEERNQVRFVLPRISTALQEAVITDRRKIPKQPQDTITFLVSDYATGNEEVLRDLIEKLPGFSVTPSGQIKVMGHTVGKILIDGKLFFSGGTKLALDNIPADAIEKLEFLKKYSENIVLKDFLNKEEKAINVVLKEDKKNILFGSSVAGFSPSRYSAHVNAFKYSPSFSINSISDINNTKRESLTFQELLDIYGGIDRFTEDPEGFFAELGDPIQSLIASPDFYDKKSAFQGFDMNINKWKKSDIKIVGLLWKNVTKQQDNNNRIYLLDGGSLEESIVNNNNADQLNAIVKGKSKYQFSETSVLDLNFKLISNHSDRDNDRNITRFGLLDTISLWQENDNTRVSSEVNWTKRWGEKIATKILLYHNHKNGNTINSSIGTLAGLYHSQFPFLDGSNNLSYSNPIETVGNEYAVKFDLLLRTNRIKPILSLKLAREKIALSTFALFSERLMPEEYNNDVNLVRKQMVGSFGLEYKSKSLKIRPSVDMQYVLFREAISGVTDNLIAFPYEIRIEKFFNAFRNISAHYKSAVRFIEPIDLVDNIYIQSPNTIVRGLGQKVFNIAYKNINLSYFDSFQKYKLEYSLTFGFQSIPRSRNFELITSNNFDLLNRTILTPRSNYSFSIMLKKKVKRFSLETHTDYNISRDIQVQNSISEEITTNSIRADFNLKYFRRSWDVRLLFGINRAANDSKQYPFRFNSNYVGASFLVYWKALQINGSYRRMMFDDSAMDTQDNLEFSLRYKKKKSPYSFSFELINLLMPKYNFRQTLDQIITSNTRIRNFPSYFVLSMGYRF